MQLRFYKNEIKYFKVLEIDFIIKPKDEFEWGSKIERSIF